MRSFWQEMPMLRVALALIAGIGLYVATGYVPALLCIMAALFIIATVISIIMYRWQDAARSFRFKIPAGLTLTSAIVSFAYLLSGFYAQNNYANHFGHTRNTQTWIAHITEPPVARQKVIMAVAEISEGKNEIAQHKYSGKILLSFSKDSASSRLSYGDVVLFDAPVQEMEGPKNPEEFNFKRYHAYRNIYHRAYLKNGDWKLLEQQQGNFFFTAVYKLRDSFLRTIERYVKDKNDFAVASAIMLGYRDYINGEVIQAYASSGVIHVLSVSGFHVAIMFLMLNLLLKRLDERGKKWVIAKAAFIILFIWFYACLTGLSPPVLRSALMFTLIQVGQVFYRHNNTYNLLTGSAVVLLLFNPFLIMDVGFQLTYLAVLGIVYLQAKIYGLLAVKNWLLDKAWLIMAVSIAAQISTVPLSLYYFHQFPNLFLLSNLVVIPLSEFILWAGTLLFVVGQIPFINDIAGWCFHILLALLNKFIFGVDALPFALMKGISITLAELLLAYVLLFLLCWLTENRKPKVLIASLVIILTLSSFSAYKTVERANQKLIAVYSVNRHSAIAFITGTTVQYYFDEGLLNDRTALNNKIRPHWWKCGIEQEVNIDTAKGDLDFGRWVLFEGKSILIVHSAPPAIALEHTLKADLVIISGNPKMTIEQLKQLVDFDEVVFDSSNNYWKVTAWKKECEELKVPYADVGKEGAYIKYLNR